MAEVRSACHAGWAHQAQQVMAERRVQRPCTQQRPARRTNRQAWSMCYISFFLTNFSSFLCKTANRWHTCGPCWSSARQGSHGQTPSSGGAASLHTGRQVEHQFLIRCNCTSHKQLVRSLQGHPPPTYPMLHTAPHKPSPTREPRSVHTVASLQHAICSPPSSLPALASRLARASSYCICCWYMAMGGIAMYCCCCGCR